MFAAVFCSPLQHHCCQLLLCKLWQVLAAAMLLLQCLQHIGRSQPSCGTGRALWHQFRKGPAHHQIGRAHQLYLARDADRGTACSRCTLMPCASEASCHLDTLAVMRWQADNRPGAHLASTCLAKTPPSWKTLGAALSQDASGKLSVKPAAAR